MAVIPAFHIAIIFLLPIVRISVNLLVSALLYDLLWFLAREEKLSDQVKGPVEEVPVILILPGPSSLPSLVEVKMMINEDSK